MFLGDYVNGGPDSAGVIDRLIALRRDLDAVCLRGNHDDLFAHALASEQGEAAFLGFGGDDTLRSYPQAAASAVPPSHRKFLAELALAWSDERVICVHGRIDPTADPAAPEHAQALWGGVEGAEPHVSGRTVVCGHTRQRSGLPLDRGHTICIDTGIKGGGWLTMLETGAWTYLQADASGRVRNGVLRPAG